jgi:type IX secretion system substrate protein
LKQLFNILTVFVFCTGSVIRMHAQTSIYRPMPVADALWSEMLTMGSGSSKWQYGIFGDTVISSVTWHKIYERNIICWDTTMTAINSNLVGAMREDVLKRVYYRSFDPAFSCSADSTYKIYDFSKNAPGDTIQFISTSGVCYNNDFLTVDYIDSIQISGSYRKRYNFIEGETWIQGIGSIRGLFSVITPFPTCSCTQALLCHKQSNTLVYINPAYNFCYCDLGVSMDEPEARQKIKIFPDPFSENTSLVIDKNLMNAILTVYNSKGQQVKQMKNISGKTILLERNGLPAGIYFLQLTQDHRILLSDKVIIVDHK